MSKRGALCISVEVDPTAHVFEYPEVANFFRHGDLIIAPRSAKLRIGITTLISYGDDSVDALRRLVYLCKGLKIWGLENNYF